MTADTDRLLSLARECGHWNGVTVEMNDVGLIAFAERIRQEEREHFIDLCANERIDAEATGVDADKAYNWAIDQCIAAIRSSGTSKSEETNQAGE